MHPALEVGAGLYGEDFVGDVGRDPGALSEVHGLGLYLSIDGAKDSDRIGHYGAVDLPLFADSEQTAFDIALDRTVDLDLAVALQVAHDLEIGADDRRNAT